MKIICLDPGHNGYGADTGAVGNNLKEQDLTLDISLKLRTLLQANGFTVVMTREGQTVSNYSTVNTSLQSRVNVAENVNADIFVSIHINAGGGTGTEVLISGSGGNAQKLANKVLPYLVNAGSWNNRGIKIEDIYVLKQTSMPAILGETGFIDTVSDAQKLASESFRQSLAEAYCKGICDYFGVSYKQNSSIQTINNNGDVKKVKNLVIYLYPEDEGCAKNLAIHLQCPVAYYPKQFLNDLFDCVENIYQVGGAKVDNRIRKCLSGNDMDDSMVEYLKYVGKIK